MSQEQAKREIERIKNRGFFTAHQTIEEYVKGVRQRWLRMYGEILPMDYTIILNKLQNF
jgi:hypothetical protein